MFRFIIRDVLWLMVVAAVLAAWWADRSRLVERLRPWAEWERLMNEDQLKRWAGPTGT